MGVYKSCSSCRHENKSMYQSLCLCLRCAVAKDHPAWEMKEEATHHDAHYQTTVQPIETMQANMTPEEFQGFLKGNIIKYACRCGRKDDAIKEAEKIMRYTAWLLQALKGATINPRN